MRSLPPPGRVTFVSSPQPWFCTGSHATFCSFILGMSASTSSHIRWNSCSLFLSDGCAATSDSGSPKIGHPSPASTFRPAHIAAYPKRWGDRSARRGAGRYSTEGCRRTGWENGLPASGHPRSHMSRPGSIREMPDHPASVLVAIVVVISVVVMVIVVPIFGQVWLARQRCRIPVTPRPRALSL